MRKVLFLIAIAFCFETEAQIITTVCGTGMPGFSGNGGQATVAELRATTDVIFDASGNYYIADAGSDAIRKVNTAGIIITIAGNGSARYSGDGGPATAAQFDGPESLAFDGFGNLYIADSDNNRIRKINTAGIIITVVGNGTQGYSGDGGQATAAELYQPMGLVFDSLGNMYIADFGNSVIRKVNTAGIINTIAGNGTYGYSGDGGQATNAELNYPRDLALDTYGNLYIADVNNNVIRKVNTAGTISTGAGTGLGAGTFSCYYGGDGGQATAAELCAPSGIAFDTSGNLYFSDTGNDIIRKINTAGIITTVAGSRTEGYSGDGGLAINAQMHSPIGIAFDGLGNLYIGDAENNVIRKVSNVVQAGIEQYATNNTISIYPNPTTGMLHIEGLMLNDNLSICDVLGSVLIQHDPKGTPAFNTQHCAIDVSTLPAGVYFIKTNQGTQKFIKQ